MNVDQMIAELRTERDGLTAAIDVLERMALARGRRRGRPPAWLSSVKVSTPGPKRVVSAATRKKMALAQRKRWAAAKKGAAG